MSPGLRLLLASAAVLAAALASGCSSAALVRAHPWERSALADPIMDPNRDPLGTALTDHVTTSRESAAGGRSVGGAGCGCN